MSTRGKLLVYLVRRDLRITDNPILHHLATRQHGFSHLLPVFVLPPNQIEVSGFLAEGQQSPYPPALSSIGKFWRCGPHRAKFLAESIWDMKNSLETLKSGLVVRVGSLDDVVTCIVESLKHMDQSLEAVWMTEEKSSEEKEEQEAVSSVCAMNNVNFKLWADEKYFIDDRDTGLQNPQDVSDVFTTYRRTQEPLIERPRASLPCPNVGSLPPLPSASWMPPQESPFVTINDYDDFERRLVQPVMGMLASPPPYPEGARSSHPFEGGESKAWDRLIHLVKDGAIANYHETRNGLIGEDYSTKLSAYLSLGCITARQIHEEMVKLEDGSEPKYVLSEGFGMGETAGTRGVRLELLWRDYMRLCTIKFGSRLFRLSGFKGETPGQANGDGTNAKMWKTADPSVAARGQNPPPQQIRNMLDRFFEGTTGMGLIDASQRELYHTGYTSNRARQNVANFLAKRLNIDWRYGAEWYESMLIDYDVSSNWANWQYVSGVGNDPRGDARLFNPVKQAFDYDTDGKFVRSWVPELKDFDKLEHVFQAWTSDEEVLEKYGLTDDVMVTDPICKIEYIVDRAPRTRTFRWKRGSGGGGRRGGGSKPGTQGDGNGNGNMGSRKPPASKGGNSMRGPPEGSQKNSPPQGNRRKNHSQASQSNNTLQGSQTKDSAQGIQVHK
ncbi:DNA photolyase, FAD-binding/Cryptochrome [Dactylonectria macrodidyma]|uniref:Cryptochrome DASH n=1 Tax=Dactylonectria macrodidyma TaxID=307937 RepID=A0A9P9FTU2_9HYPO|nr:DNA photolyase, FAD-binding/Cryptochrome [Dactylonectria macrodidyma]